MSLLKRIIFLVLLIILIIVVGHFSNSIANWGMALKWHMFNDNEVVFHEMKLNLPLRWWVDSKNEEQLILNVVPPHGINFYGIVVFRKKMISKEELFSFKNRRKIDQEEVIFDKIEIKRIENEKAFGITYKVVNFPYSQNFTYIYEFWTIPSKRMVVSAVRIPEKYRRIFLELFSRISFKKAKGDGGRRKKGHTYFF